MRTRKVLINASRTRFYCWFWDQWWACPKLGRCFNKGCMSMYVPQFPHLRKARLLKEAACGQI